MPNWCMNSIVFYTKSENTAELKRLHDSLLRQLKTEKGFIETDFGSGWLGFTAHNHGLDHESNFCRGEIDSVEDAINLSNPSFTIQTSTAWSPKMELWEEVCKLYNGVMFVFFSEEGGNGVFINSDRSGKYFSERYYVSSCCNKTDKPLPKEYFLESANADEVYGDSVYYDSLDALADYTEKITGKRFETADEIEKYLQAALDIYSGGEAGISIHEFAYE